MDQDSAASVDACAAGGRVGEIKLIGGQGQFLNPDRRVTQPCGKVRSHRDPQITAHLADKGGLSLAAASAAHLSVEIADGRLILVGRVGEYTPFAFKVEHKTLDLPLSARAKLPAVKPVAGECLAISGAGH